MCINNYDTILPYGTNHNIVSIQSPIQVSASTPQLEQFMYLHNRYQTAVVTITHLHITSHHVASRADNILHKELYVRTS